MDAGYPFNLMIAMSIKPATRSEVSIKRLVMKLYHKAAKEKYLKGGHIFSVAHSPEMTCDNWIQALLNSVYQSHDLPNAYMNWKSLMQMAVEHQAP